MRLAILTCLALGGLASAAAAQVEIIDPAGLKYDSNSLLAIPAATIGSPATPGALYSLFVRINHGKRSPTHSHPDDRIVTVLKGTLYVGSGPDRLGPAAAQPVPAGHAILIHAGVPHYSWAKDGDVLVEETGRGPTGTVLVPNQK
jgi:hypothetical protein